MPGKFICCHLYIEIGFAAFLSIGYGCFPFLFSVFMMPGIQSFFSLLLHLLFFSILNIPTTVKAGINYICVDESRAGCVYSGRVVTILFGCYCCCCWHRFLHCITFNIVVLTMMMSAFSAYNCEKFCLVFRKLRTRASNCTHKISKCVCACNFVKHITFICIYIRTKIQHTTILLSITASLLLEINRNC